MISVVLATHNEEKNLARCLRSVQDLADEIIIADGKSTDDTVKIARKFKARVIITPNKPNFHINKQMAMDEAKGDLVLQLDADEVADAQLIEFIKKEHQARVIDKSKDLSAQPVAWWIKRKNYFMGGFLKKGGQYPDPVIRLYVNGYARLPQKDVHEQMAVDGEVGWAEGHLIHYSHPTFSDYWRKFKSYTTFKAQNLRADKFQPSVMTAIQYLFLKPVYTFVSIFIRHKGFLDGFRGLVFAVMSALHHPLVFIKIMRLNRSQQS